MPATDGKPKEFDKVRALRGLAHEAEHPHTQGVLQACNWQIPDLGKLQSLSDDDFRRIGETRNVNELPEQLRRALTMLHQVLAARLMPFALGLAARLNELRYPSEKASTKTCRAKRSKSADSPDSDQYRQDGLDESPGFDPTVIERSEAYWTKAAATPVAGDALTAALRAAHDMILGTCQCQDESTRWRMGRRDPGTITTNEKRWSEHCRASHCIDGWNPDEQTLYSFLSNAVIKGKKQYENLADAVWSGANRIRKGKEIDEISGGILLPHLETASGTPYEVIPVARCSECKEVLTENKCHCHRKKSTKWPNVGSAEKYIVPKGDYASSGELRRCPVCRSSKKIHKKGCTQKTRSLNGGKCDCPLAGRLFFGTHCPACDSELQKDTTPVWLPVRSASATYELPAHVEIDEPAASDSEDGFPSAQVLMESLSIEALEAAAGNLERFGSVFPERVRQSDSFCELLDLIQQHLSAMLKEKMCIQECADKQNQVDESEQRLRDLRKQLGITESGHHDGRSTRLLQTIRAEESVRRRLLDELPPLQTAVDAARTDCDAACLKLSAFLKPEKHKRFLSPLARFLSSFKQSEGKQSEGDTHE